MMPSVTILQGDVLEQLRTLPPESVHCCVTSPPYWGLRDYGVAGQIGLEPTPEEYVARMLDVFREVRRVLRPDGTCWINLGDAFWSNGKRGSGGVNDWSIAKRSEGQWMAQDVATQLPLKPKDLCGIPWRVAFALQADGWYLRQDIIWHKPNPIPESVTDRCTKAHEYIFLLAKSERYFYDAEAIKEPDSGQQHHRNVLHGAPSLEPSGGLRNPNSGVWGTPERNGRGRNKRSVWTVPSSPYPEAHFATYPPDLIKPCILAGTSAKGCCPKCGEPWERVVVSFFGLRSTSPSITPTPMMSATRGIRYRFMVQFGAPTPSQRVWSFLASRPKVLMRAPRS